MEIILPLKSFNSINIPHKALFKGIWETYSESQIQRDLSFQPYC